MSYSELLSPEMRETLNGAGYFTPTPIQDMTLPMLLAGKDLIGVAQTGTGKTAAFAVPIIEKAVVNNRRPQAIILCPTRELALQTTEVFRNLSKHTGLRVVAVYGGQSPNVQIRALRGGAQIIVGTPGRVKDLLARNIFNLKNIRFAVLDEADEMLDYGFLPDIKHILSFVTEPHQTMLFSATMSKEIAALAAQFLRDPKRVEAGVRNQPTETVRQMCISAEDSSKLPAIKYMMKENAPRLTMIFCNTRRRVKNLTKALNAAGTVTSCLHGDLSQSQRDSVMHAFRTGVSSVLVATDVAARGIDVDNIDLVINYDVPDKPEYYVHRIGRTGRAGHEGLACTLVSSKDKSSLLNIRRRYHVLMG